MLIVRDYLKAGEKLEQTKFYPRVSHTEALNWLAAADAAILPISAKFEIGRRFTSPLKLFEYLAAGLPIVTSDAPSSHDALDVRTTIFFKPDDAQGFVQALYNFIRLSEASKALMSEGCRHKSQNFTWKIRGFNIFSFIRKIL